MPRTPNRRKPARADFRAQYAGMLQRMTEHGPHTLSALDLVSIITRTPPAELAAADLAAGNLARHHRATVAELAAAYPGHGAQLAAAMEFARRAEQDDARTRLSLDSPESVYKLLRPRYAAAPVEHFVLLSLDTKNRLIRQTEISTGDLNSAVVHPREVFAELIVDRAAAFIAAHNHPSGDPTPSQRDIDVTQRLMQCADLFGIRLLDHVIVAAQGYYSFQAHGLMSPPRFAPSV